MKVQLIRAALGDAEAIWKMQIASFAELLHKYQDFETSPACEPLTKVTERLRQESTYFYFIRCDEQTVGAVRIVDVSNDSVPKRISPLFVLPAFRNLGIAQKAIAEAEKIHGAANWELATILQEKGNCHLYEKMGYRQTGETKVINDNLTFVFYQKD